MVILSPQNVESTPTTGGLDRLTQSKINEYHTTKERLPEEQCAQQSRFSRVRTQMKKLNSKTIKNGKTVDRKW
jgi:hypothetical protein